jgi:hypothetical protein
MSTGKVGDARYDGYTSCPLFIDRGSLLLAEFKYGLERKETFGTLFDQSKPNKYVSLFFSSFLLPRHEISLTPRAFYHLTKDVIPRAYFAKHVKGEWFGPRAIFPPQYLPQ